MIIMKMAHKKEKLLDILCSILRNCKEESIEIYPHQNKRRMEIIPGVYKLHLHGLLFELGFLKWAKQGGEHIRTSNKEFDNLPYLLSTCEPSITVSMNVKQFFNKKHWFVHFTHPNDKSEPLSQSDMNILEELRKKCIDNKKSMATVGRKNGRKNIVENDDSSDTFVSNMQNQSETKTSNRKRKVSIESTDLAEEDDGEPRRSPMAKKTKEWYTYSSSNKSRTIQVGHSNKLKEVTVPKNYTLISDYKLAQIKDENSRMKLELSLWAHEYNDIDAEIARGLKKEVERLKILLKKEECRHKESDSKCKEVVENEFKDHRNEHDIQHRQILGGIEAQHN